MGGWPPISVRGFRSHPMIRFLWHSIQQWNLGYQREFTRNMVFELGYVGSKGTRLVKTIDINQSTLT